MKILIIGAGGVTSYLIPCLIKAFKISSLFLMDKDRLEKRNLDRQLFTEKQVGAHKVDALIQLYEPNNCQPVFYAIREWLTPVTEVGDLDLVICCADNHEARRNAISLAYRKDVPCYLGGNEYFDAEAYRTVRDDEGTAADPRVRYPAIATSTEGSPVSCQGEQQEIHPQLAIANQRCATHLLHLLYIWETVHKASTPAERRVLEANLPIEIQSTLTTVTCLTKPQILKK